VPEWPTFLLRSTVARSSHVTFLESAEDDVRAGGDGAVPVSGRVLVAAIGGGVGTPAAGHHLALAGAGPSGEGAGCVTEVADVEPVVSHLAVGPAPVLVEGRGQEEATALGGKDERVRVRTDAIEVPGEGVEGGRRSLRVLVTAVR
jgi:hypothetical protein